MRWTCLCVALLWGTPTALAHIAPAVSENNRYIKVSAVGRRVRLAYTVYLGEVPGQMVRMKMDTNHDGELTEAEYSPYGAELAAKIAPLIKVSINDTPMSTTWDKVYVGLNDPRTSAGAFSVDLVAWYCLPGDASSYTLLYRDAFVPESPGENELRLDSSPDVVVDKTVFGPDSALKTRWLWLAADSEIAKQGLSMTFHYDSAPAPDPKCPVARDAARPRSTRAFVLAGGVLLLALLAIVLVMRRRK